MAVELGQTAPFATDGVELAYIYLYVIAMQPMQQVVRLHKVDFDDFPSRSLFYTLACALHPALNGWISRIVLETWRPFEMVFSGPGRARRRLCTNGAWGLWLFEGKLNRELLGIEMDGFFLFFFLFLFVGEGCLFQFSKQFGSSFSARFMWLAHKLSLPATNFFFLSSPLPTSVVLLLPVTIAQYLSS